MNMGFFKKIIENCKLNYGKMFVLGLSVILLAIMSFALYYANMGLEIISFLLFFVGVLPLLLSFQLVCSRILTNHEVNYNEIYKNYKAYFNPVFRGCYSVIFFSIIAFLVNDILFSIFYSLNLDPSLTQDILNIDINVIYSAMESIMETNDFKLVAIAIYGISAFILIMGICSRFVIPYFNYLLGVPTRATKNIIKELKKAKSNYKKQKLLINMPIFVLFFITYFVTAYLTFYFQNNVGISVFFALSLSLIILSLYLPFYITGAFELALENRDTAFSCVKILVNNDLYKLLNDTRIPQEQKDKIKEKIDSFKQNIDEKIDEENNNESEK